MRETTMNMSDRVPALGIRQPVFLQSGNGLDFVLEKPRAKVATLADLLPSLLDKLERGDPPTRWLVDDQTWGTFALRPKHIVLVGGPTNSGKTAFATSTMFKAMKVNPCLRVLIASTEEDTEDLVYRGIARLLDINIRHLRNCDRTHLTPAILDTIRCEMELLQPRLRIVQRPFTVDQVVSAAKDFGADVVVVDYLQDLRLDGFDGELQETVRRLMPELRSLADAGPCVLLMSALSRSGVSHIQGRTGSRLFNQHDHGVFLGATQIEYAVNDAYVLLHDNGTETASVNGEMNEKPRRMWLQHLKSRGDEIVLVPLTFDGRYQKFTLRPINRPETPKRNNAGTTAAASGPRAPAATVAKAKPSKAGNADDHYFR
jgi:archaellum biogenesis ATPase FlaH